MKLGELKLDEFKLGLSFFATFIDRLDAFELARGGGGAKALTIDDAFRHGLKFTQPVMAGFLSCFLWKTIVFYLSAQLVL